MTARNHVRLDARLDAGRANQPGRLDARLDATGRSQAPGASIPPVKPGGIDAPCAVRPGFWVGLDARLDARIDAAPRRRIDARVDAPIDARPLPRPNPHTPDGARATAEFVLAALEEAGLVLLALPNSGPSTRLRQGGLEWVRDACAYPPDRTLIRPAVPSAAAIDRMDRVLAWIPRIPADKFVLRRVVGARCLVSPVNGRHLFSWRRLGAALGADHKAVQRWHAQGIDLIVAALNVR